MSYWQVSAGDKGRNYTDFFINYGLAFFGKKFKTAFDNINKGDILVLKSGKGQILAAGVVVERDGKVKGNGDKSWLFDIDGWNLSLYCFVDWCQPTKPVTVKGLSIGGVLRMPQKPHQLTADKILSGHTARKLMSEPEPCDPVTIEEILRFLVNEGLRPASATELVNVITKIKLLASYYFANYKSNEIREHETRTFLVIPFLLALGWSEQQMKIELPCTKGASSKKGKIDIACFSKGYRMKGAQCSVIIETKGLSLGLDYAPAQVKQYAVNFPECNVLVVTNGYAYKIYLKKSGSFPASPTAYLNLLNPRSKYPLNPSAVDGALEGVKWLLPFNAI